MFSERFMNEYEIRQELEGSPHKAGPPIAYMDNVLYKSTSSAHEIFLGMTGSGKTLFGILNLIMSVIHSDDQESFICIDPKGDIYAKTSSLARKKGYDVRLVSYRDVLHSEGFNPLWIPYRLFRSKNSRDHQRAFDLLEDIGQAIWPDETKDPFWPQSARQTFTAACLTLFHEGTPEQINIVSLYNIIAEGSQRLTGGIRLQEYIRNLPDERSEKLLFGTYAYAPNDTRASIRSVFENGLSRFIVNAGIKEMSCNDTLSILKLDDSKALAIYIVLPDETDAYAPQAAMLCDQLLLHFINVAQHRPNGMLRRRLNVIIEELASVGKALPRLPHLMAAARSRNIRLHCVLQDIRQLTTLFGESDASAIKNNADIIMFRLTNFETLQEYSKLCGQRVMRLPDGTERTEPLVTENQLLHLKTGQALIFCGRHKLVSQLPYYGEVFDLKDYEPPKPYPRLCSNPIKVYSLPKVSPSEFHSLFP